MRKLQENQWPTYLLTTSFSTIHLSRTCSFLKRFSVPAFSSIFFWTVVLSKIQCSVSLFKYLYGVAHSYLCFFIDSDTTYMYKVITMSSLWTWTDINYIHAVANIVDNECWRWNVCWLQDIMLTIIVQLLISEKYVVFMTLKAYM